MKSAKKLLGFDFDAATFARRAPQPIKMRRSIIDLLEKIADEYSDKSDLSDQESLRQIYFLFIDCPPGKFSAEFDTSLRIRKLSRVLTYSESELPRIVDTPRLEDALQLIENYFSISAMLAVFDALLQAWDTVGAPNLQAFIKKHLINYNGNRKLIRRLKANMMWYCEQNGPTQLALKLLRSGTKLSDVWSYLELPDYTQNYRYFGAVAEVFVVHNKHLKQKDMMKMVKDIVNFFTKHNNEETIRAVLPKLIKRLGRNASEDLRQPIQDYILQEWQDPRSAAASMRWHGVPDETWRIFMRWIMEEDLRFF